MVLFNIIVAELWGGLFNAIQNQDNYYSYYSRLKENQQKLNCPKNMLYSSIEAPCIIGLLAINPLHKEIHVVSSKDKEVSTFYLSRYTLSLSTTMGFQLFIHRNTRCA